MRTDWTPATRRPALTWDAEEALAMDTWLTEQRGFTLDALMGAAGAALAEAVTELRAAWGCGRVVFLAGPGNNGGDARVARDTLGGERAGALWQPLDGDPPPPLGPRDLLVDGLFGVGLSRPVEGDAAAALRHVALCGAQVLAVDVPSGLHATRGEVLGTALRARATLCFVGPKTGFFTGDGPRHVGLWAAAEIGFPAAEAEAWLRARRAAGS